MIYRPNLHVASDLRPHKPKFHLARRVCRDVTRRAKWNLGLCGRKSLATCRFGLYIIKGHIDHVRVGPIVCVLTADVVVDVDTVVSASYKSSTELRFSDALSTTTTNLPFRTHSVICKH